MSELVEALPVEDGECNTPYSSMILHHLADPEPGIQEMARPGLGSGSRQ